jgi:hypothetical protein
MTMAMYLSEQVEHTFPNCIGIIHFDVEYLNVIAELHTSN